MKLLCAAVLLLALSGCTASAPVPSSVPEYGESWAPPAAQPCEEAEACLAGLELCRSFLADMNERYPDFAPHISADDMAYYESHLADPRADYSLLAAELRQSITSLRQQVYRNIEAASKLGAALPDGLENALRDWEDLFVEAGWQ